MAKLNPAFTALARKLQEASIALSHNDISRALSDCLRDMGRDGTGNYYYMLDFYGDESSGDVVYVCSGDTMRAPYELGTANGKRTCMIDAEKAVDVVPRTVYDEEADEADHMAAMQEGRIVERFEGAAQCTDLRFSERFISKGERDAMSSEDFAGKNKSFPLKVASDVMAAVRSIGRAGADNFSPSTIKANIIKIAKRKGWTKYLPKAWQTDGAKESASEIDITGDVQPLVALREGGAVGMDGTAKIKLIAPGWGSSGYYPAEVLERDGPKVFRKGTKMYWDHQTATQEAERPEGSLRDLASELIEDAKWESGGSDGPGLYAKTKVFEQFRQSVDDLAPHIGVSIRAMGEARPGEVAGRKGTIIEKLTRAQSVDYVTQAGAGGKVLQLFEAARSAAIQPQGGGDSDMDAAELTKLQESVDATRAENRKLRERMALSDAAQSAAKYFKGVRVSEAIAERVTARVLAGRIPLTESGDLNEAEFQKLIDAETKDEVKYIEKLTDGRVVTNMGTGAPAEPTAEQRQAEAAAREKEMSESAKSLWGVKTEEGAKLFAVGRAGFDPTYNSADKKGAA